ncbi:MAG: hypothetical protein NT135_00400 [Candidatus Berkelbacteria bacterium]|nr:hypothetical protein [Candidatus Berkelbacteria bacterium]
MCVGGLAGFVLCCETSRRKTPLTKLEERSGVILVCSVFVWYNRLTMPLWKIEDYKILFLDMDSFFASIEQQVNPNLRDKPIAIAPYTGKTGCVISASRKAKECGIKTGMMVGEAIKIYPQVKILEARPFLYHLYHKEIVKVMQSFSPFLKILSIDEMAVPLEIEERNSNKIIEIAQKIKSEIKRKIGNYLTCSIGVGPNQFLAKVTAEFKKPDGFFCVSIKELGDFYSKLKLTDLPGINIRMEQALHCAGIKTALEFYKSPQEYLTRFFNHPGKVWYLRLKGYEVDDYQSKTRNMGHSFVLPPQFRKKEEVKKVLIKLAFKLGYRLRKEKFFAKGLSLSIRFLNHTTIRKWTTSNLFSDNKTLISLALNLFSKIDFKDAPIHIYLYSYNLTKSRKQYSLFSETEKQSQFSEVVDKINDKYGANTIYSASMDKTDEAAPDRIPFGKPRYEIKY